MPVGEVLREARERRGLTVDEVAAATRIRGTLIRAIENDNYDPCGGSVYARGHIRSIGHVVGVDPEPLITEYDAAHGGPPGGPAPIALTSGYDPQVEVSSRPRRPNWTAAAIVCLLVIIGVAAWALASGGGSPARTADRSGRTPAVGSRSPAVTHHRKKPHKKTPPVRASGVTVQIRVTSDESWCSVDTATGANLFQGLLAAGQSQTFHASGSLTLILGNAPVVDLVVDGQQRGTPPSTGSVARLTIGLSGQVIQTS